MSKNRIVQEEYEVYTQSTELTIFAEYVWIDSDQNLRSKIKVFTKCTKIYSKTDFPLHTPHYSKITETSPDILANGGSCIAGPDGEWILEPDTHTDGNIYHTLDFNKVYQERQNFDPVGHYSRPDVTKLTINTERQSTISLVNSKDQL